jgi:hypothetical protein
VPLLALFLVLLAPLVAVALLPVTLVQRYRTGTSRRRARRWLTTVNIVASGVSIGCLLRFAAVTSVWIPGALIGALAGLLSGAAIGVAGLALSRWEAAPHGLHYTPNRWLVLTITLLVTARLVYGLWRAWDAWAMSTGDAGWLGTAGVPGSLAAGGVVLGYHVTYWIGVRRQLARHARAGATVTIDHGTGRISYDR